MRTSTLAIMLAAVAAMLAPETGQAANTLRHFFPKENDLFNTIDDEVVVKDIFWADSASVDWVLYRSFGSVLIPALNLNNISDAEILDATERALQEWNSSSLSSFKFEDDVFFSDDVIVGDPPLDALLDGVNTIIFQSLILSQDSGVIAQASVFFMERDFDAAEFLGVPVDVVESLSGIPIDIDEDGFVDITLEPRDYEQAEIFEADIIFNSAITSEYRVWPQDISDVPPGVLIEVPGSTDIQAVMTHELGHTFGIAHTQITAATMSPVLLGPTDDFPTNPYDMRSLALDDFMGAAKLYPGQIDDLGGIAGQVLDGQFVAAQAALGVTLDEIHFKDPQINDQLFVVSAPVFVGVPAPHGIHPDNKVASDGDTFRLIAQVFTGTDLIYPAAEGGVSELEPSSGADPNIDFDDLGEDVDGDGVLDPGEDTNVNGVLDITTRKVNGDFQFIGLEAREDYVVYIDQAFNPFFTIASFPDELLGQLESFSPEFYGGTSPANPLRDDFTTDDDPGIPEFLTVDGGTTPVHITIITNTDAIPPDDPGGPGGQVGFNDGDPGPAVTFVESNSITQTSSVPLGADMGDLNKDGYPDLVVAVFTGGSDPADLFNRVYLNQPIDLLDPTSARFLSDVTFGPDGLAGTADDILPPHAENSRDAKLADFNNDGRLDLFVTNAANGLPGQLTGLGGFDRLYINEEDAGSAYGFRFRDVSEFVLPGLLNRGWGPDNPFGWTDPYHAAVGDIDGDGDVDIIISLFTAQDDTLLDPNSPFFEPPTIAAIDSEPNSIMGNPHPGDNMYTPQPGPMSMPPAGDHISGPSESNSYSTYEIGSFGEDANGNGTLDTGEDVDADGNIDVNEDVDGDGNLDVFEDVDFDGKLDLVAEDVDGDGILDPSEDLNNNGVLDPGEDIDNDMFLDPSEDLDGDLFLDIAEDVDGDGNLDVQEDLDGDGKLDTVDEDTNMDGFLEPNEDRNLNGILDCPVIGSPLVFCERVLINKTNDPDSPGFRFVDETLGADNRFGNSEDLHTNMPPPAPYDGALLEFSPNTDRIPPVFPVTRNLGANCAPANKLDSPMSWRAIEPHLGPIWKDGGLDLISVRMFRDVRNPPGDFDRINNAENAMFQNLDVRTPDGFTANDVLGSQYLLRDGIGDGYFACINYGTDYRYRDGSGLFPIRLDQDTTLTLERMPLLIGIPDGVTGDIGGTPAEANLFQSQLRGGFTGLVGDWEYRGAPKPMILADQSFGTGFLFTPRVVARDSAGLDEGALRAHNGTVTGQGINYNFQRSVSSSPYAIGLFGSGSILNEQLLSLFQIDGGVTFSSRDVPALNGEAHGSVSTDFDSDGDFDLFIAQNVVSGFGPERQSTVTDVPAADSFFTNDNFGFFANASATALPPNNQANPPTIGYVALSADLDNDADKDIVVINALSPHEVLLNQMYTPNTKPNPSSVLVDSTMFYDQTPEYLPPIFGVTLAPPFQAGTYGSITTSATSADFNNDGFPDLATADGGIFSQGDFSQYLMNSGPRRAEAFRPFGEAQNIFQPVGAPFPGKRILPPFPIPQTPTDSPIPDVAGFLNDEFGGFYGVSSGDFSGDGYPDLFYSRNGEGPTAYVNLDSGDAFGIALLTFLIPPGIPGYSTETFLNSAPDADNIPDGIMMNLNQIENLVPALMPDISDPCPDQSGSIVRKNFNHRLAAADFDGNGTLDVCIANGVAGTGAPNLLMLNFPTPIFPFTSPIPRFIDATETNLPTTIGACGQPEGIPNNCYAIAAADFDHDGDVDMIFGNQTNFFVTSAFPPFRYLVNDGFGVFADTGQLDGSNPNIPVFENTNPSNLMVCDVDGVGEWTEDLNHNGVLDSGEDYNGNGLLDVSEDVNGNGVLDPGEDKNANGLLDLIDLADETVAGDINGDGIITARVDGVWEPSWDVYISFYGRQDELLINDPTNAAPGIFSPEGAVRLPDPPVSLLPGVPLVLSGGARCGDLDLDGDMDIVVAKGNQNAAGSRGVWFLLNNGQGFFSDASHEIPFPKSIRWRNEAPTNIVSNTNAFDLELLDADGDGDLDIYVANTGSSSSLLVIGAEDNFYINRTIGGNGNIGGLKPSQAVAAAPAAPAPVVFAAEPSGLVIGTSGPVTVSGKNLMADTQLDFGPGVAVGGVTFVSPYQLVVDLAVDAQADIGPRGIDVANPSDGLSSKAATGTFNVLAVPVNKVGQDEWKKYD